MIYGTTPWFLAGDEDQLARGRDDDVGVGRRRSRRLNPLAR